jgi:hypothetical protein
MLALLAPGWGPLADGTVAAWYQSQRTDGPPSATCPGMLGESVTAGTIHVRI